MAVNTALLNAALFLRHSSNTYLYYRSHGRFPNYVEPRNFNEKVQWRKLFDRNPLLQCFVDKLAVRAYVAEHAPTLRFPKILWTGTDPDAIPYENLPERIVVKPSHRSGDIAFVHSREDLDRDRIAAACRRWLTRPYGRSRREWAYQGLNGQLMVEEMLQTGPDPHYSRDYRCYVCNGTVEALLVNAGVASRFGHRFTGEGLVFDRAWNRLPYNRAFDREPIRADPGRPEPLDDMIAAAESLGREIDCVRVDLFVIGKEVYFSELTIYQGSGMNEISIDRTIATPVTEPFEVFLGRKWTLPTISFQDQLKRGLLGA